MVLPRFALIVLACSAACPARAQIADESGDEDDVPLEALPAAPAPEPPPITFHAWVELYWGYNFHQPSNGITDLRGFDNRHNSFNLSNVAVEADLDWEGVNGRVVLQWGSTPATYYLAETRAPSGGTGVGAQDFRLWQFVQQAYVGYEIPIGGGLNVQAGLFMSPIGPESMNVKDDWLYSRSNLFYGFPFYHTGVRLTYAVTEELSAIVCLFNGWNTVLDNNDEKTIALELTWSTPDLLSASLTYLGGVERPTGADEGRAWRHTFDLNATYTPFEELGVQGQIAGGFEDHVFGTSAYLAGALAAQVVPIEWLAIAMRGDFFWERVPAGAGAIFWPVEWVGSVTGTVQLRPHEHVSLWIEFRHDEASGPAYFAGAVVGDGDTVPFVRNAGSQDTLTIGATGWL